MKKNVLILCCGYPYQTDKGVGFRVWQELEKIKLPEYVEVMEVGESACMMPSVIAEKDKVIFVDFLETKDSPGTIVRLKLEELPVNVNGFTDMPKFHLMETLEQLDVIGQIPEIVFLGIVPKDVETEILNPQLTPEVERKIPEVINLIIKEIAE